MIFPDELEAIAHTVLSGPEVEVAPGADEPHGVLVVDLEVLGLLECRNRKGLDVGQGLGGDLEGIRLELRGGEERGVDLGGPVLPIVRLEDSELVRPEGPGGGGGGGGVPG